MVAKYCGLATRMSVVGRRSGSSTTRPSMSNRVVPGRAAAERHGIGDRRGVHARLRLQALEHRQIQLPLRD